MENGGFCKKFGEINDSTESMKTRKRKRLHKDGEKLDKGLMEADTRQSGSSSLVQISVVICGMTRVVIPSRVESMRFGEAEAAI